MKSSNNHFDNKRIFLDFEKAIIYIHLYSDNNMIVIEISYTG